MRRLFVVVSPILALASCTTLTSPAQLKNEPTAVVPEIAARFSRCEIDPLLENYALSAEFSSPNTKTPITGHAALREYFAGACQGSVRPVMKLVSQTVHTLAPGAVLVTGVYTFGRSDRPSEAPWSGSFVITLVPSEGRWVIRSQATFETPS